MDAPLLAATGVMGLVALVAVGASPLSTTERHPTQDQPKQAPTRAPATAPAAGDAPPAAVPVCPAPPADDDPLPTQIPNLSDAGLPVVRLTLGSEPFDLELAATDDAIAKGLSGRDRVRRHRGMLFVMPYSREQGFWMIDCLVPIDIAFMNEQGVVTAVHTMKTEPPQRADESRGAYEVRLPRYPSGAKARYAIELAAGEFARLGIAKGSEIKVDWQAVNTVARATRVAGSKR
ncbi:MAG: DUF192 domain-containing protein [Planctomycetes bacterium]|nr:DUF192 domain-containing protein [Planctomycetota bacterium]